MKKEQKVRLDDGRVGNIVKSGKTEVVVRVPVETVSETGRIVAALEDISFAPQDFKAETEWLEGPDEFNRYWDQDGNQVVFHPDGSESLMQNGLA